MFTNPDASYFLIACFAFYKTFTKHLHKYSSGMFVHTPNKYYPFSTMSILWCAIWLNISKPELTAKWRVLCGIYAHLLFIGTLSNIGHILWINSSFSTPTKPFNTCAHTIPWLRWILTNIYALIMYSFTGVFLFRARCGNIYRIIFFLIFRQWGSLLISPVMELSGED